MLGDSDIVVYKAISENENLPVFLVGHSRGGFCVCLYGCKLKDKLAGIVSSGALSKDNGR